jgi:hypothetical protein
VWGRVGFPTGESGKEGFPINRLGFHICRNNLPLLAEGEPYPQH